MGLMTLIGGPISPLTWDLLNLTMFYHVPGGFSCYTSTKKETQCEH